MRIHGLMTALCGAAVLAGCGSDSTVNPFLTYSELVGVAGGGASNDNGGGGGGGGGSQDAVFRREMDVTFANNHPSADLEFRYVAWVNSNSIRSAEQQDALLASGYVQLTREVQLGSVFTLPPGTFVLNGEGTAGATKVALRQATASTDGSTVTATSETLTLITPDVFLVFSQPPVSCDTVAFVYSRDGDPITDDFTNGFSGPYEGSTGLGGYKTLTQINAYDCEPLRPGLFLKLGGGAREPNEFFEGEDVRFDFNPVPDGSGKFGIVTIQ